MSTLRAQHYGTHSLCCWVASQADGVDESERRTRQDSVNPAYVPRNHVMQEAVKLADQGDYSEVQSRRHAAHQTELAERMGVEPLVPVQLGSCTPWPIFATLPVIPLSWRLMCNVTVIDAGL